MNTFNTKATNTMKIKCKTESLFNKLAFLVSCLSCASLFFMMCIIFDVISLDNWPFFWEM